MTLKETALLLGIPETTLRLIREEFADIVPVQGDGRRRRYADEGVAALRQIVEWRRAGWGGPKIRAELSRTKTPVEPRTRRLADEHFQEISARLAAQSAEIALLRVEVGALRSEIMRLTQVLRPTPAPTVQMLLEQTERDAV